MTKTDKYYELTNHLGNVMAVLSDAKHYDHNAQHFTAHITQAQDYLPFGSPMPGRNFNSNSYRYGAFNKEKDDEIKGVGNSIDLGERMYDPRLGRTPSPDNKAAKYPNISPYAYAANNPIYYIDPDGNDVEVYVTATKVGTTKINLFSGPDIEKNASLKGKTAIVAVYEVQVKNESGSSATFYFTRTAYRGDPKNPNAEPTDVTFDVRNDKDEFLGVVKSRWKGQVNNVLELKDADKENGQFVEGMKGDVEAIREAIQFHLKGASDGCLLCVGSDQFESIEKGVEIDKTDLELNSKNTQRNFMDKVMEFQKEDKEAGKGDAIKVKFDKLGKSSTKEEKKE